MFKHKTEYIYQNKKPRGNPIDSSDITSNHHAHTKRARTQIADRPEEQFDSVPSRALPPKGMPNGMILFILL